MNVPVHVLDGVIDDRVLIVALQSFAGFQFIAEDRRTRFNVFANMCLKFLLPSVINDHCTHFAVTAQLAAAITTLLRRPDSVKHEPRGLLSDAQRTSDLAGTNSVLAIKVPKFGLKCPQLIRPA